MSQVALRVAETRNERHYLLGSEGRFEQSRGQASGAADSGQEGAQARLPSIEVTPVPEWLQAEGGALLLLLTGLPAFREEVRRESNVLHTPIEAVAVVRALGGAEEAPDEGVLSGKGEGAIRGTGPFPQRQQPPLAKLLDRRGLLLLASQ